MPEATAHIARADPQDNRAANRKHPLREMLGIFLIFCALFLMLALITFDASDPSVNFVKSGEARVNNNGGLFGAYAAGLLNDFLGIGAFIWPAIFVALGAAHISPRIVPRWQRWTGFFLLTLCLLTAASAWDLSIGDLSGGGVAGATLERESMRYLSPVGSALLWFFVFLAGIQLVANISWIAASHLAWHKLQAWLAARKDAVKPGHANNGLAETARKYCAPAIAALRKLVERIPLPAQEAAPAEQARAAASPPATPFISGAKPPAPAAETAPAANAAFQDIQDDDPFAPAQELLPEQPSTPDPFPPANPALAASSAPSSPPAPHAQRAIASSSAAGPDSDVLALQPAAPPEAKQLPPEAMPLIEPVRQIQAAQARPDIRLYADKEPDLPSPQLLHEGAPQAGASQEELEELGRALMACFENFDIHGELARITPGPVVTMFEMRPAPGIRVSKIANLADDLSRALKAVAVRIQAPVPGSDTVGIEIPNVKRETVNFRQLAESAAFQDDKGALTMILGKNIAGAPYIADLARMPHMLVAGATGAGKSVCLNSILVSLLFRLPPAKMRLLLVDPKRIELSMYSDLPHLVHPVVTEMDDAKNALDWAVADMKNRYKTFERMGVKNIASFNGRLAVYGDNLPPGLEDLTPMSYLVIVIDELADLMMTAAREVETSIVRLAQLARAAGIHMILATQRPSVDVVTGLIKANFPCRISFQVTSKHDSRTILDQVGAEHLLGRGDMLFKPSGQPLLRLHGPYLSDDEVQAVVNHWKGQLPADYQVDFSQWAGETAAANTAVSGDATSDALYGEARAFVLDQGRASISLLQRQLKIGFNRAARLMEQFEREGLIGPADGSKPRNVIR